MPAASVRLTACPLPPASLAGAACSWMHALLRYARLTHPRSCWAGDCMRCLAMAIAVHLVNGIAEQRGNTAMTRLI
jgi:hypothetical protein